MPPEDASCWVHKDLTVTTKQIQALLTAARASGGKDECQVRLSGIERRYWMSTLWRQEESLRICSKEELAEKAQDIEVTIPVKKSQEARYNLDSGSFFENGFWGRQLDGIAINEALQIVHILKSKQSTDRDEEFLEVKEEESE